MKHAPRITAAFMAAATMAFACAAAAQVQSAPAATSRPATQPAAQTSAKPALQSARPASPPAATGLRAEPVPPQVDAAFKAFDTDHNGSLNLAEFRTGWQTMRRGGTQTTQVRLQQQFKQLDANDNGGIERTEYPNVLLVKRAGSAAPPFSEFDRDGSQKLDFAEYTELVRRLSAVQTSTVPPRK